ncbi:hypothetical protein BOX15_Mlig014382g1 [Macrostomum lignano]|uniref:Uncharacterized protein n=1 Tax=Macrostomum lignano TaxID=282301 RepID=A0A267EP31_9PLAT|nr:hypothetical protein BOX15_Mlig014382g2 [Macrostomum lignano]PAA63290.1 hypothetical protein BOX15_Mlig014382g1 [Macrostomum lignano]
MVDCVVLSSSKSYIRSLSSRYNCIQAGTVRRSFGDQLACFRFNFEGEDRERDRERDGIFLYHAWSRELEKTAASIRVRLPSKVHKYCSVYAVAVRFKDPVQDNWMGFLAEMEDESAAARSSGRYHRWEKLEVPDCGTSDPIVIVSSLSDADELGRTRPVIYNFFKENPVVFSTE